MRRTPRLFWFLLGAIGLGLVLLIANHEGGSTFGLRNNAFAASLYLGAWALALAAAISGSRIGFSEAARNLALWILAMLLLVFLYLIRDSFWPLARLFANLTLPAA